MHRLNHAAILFCVLAIAALSTTAANAKRQCRWIGTAPSCDGKNSDCGADEDFIEYGGSVANSNTGNSLAEFGAPCSFGGGKVLCCKKEAPAPAPQPTLAAPTNAFCDWYMSEAVARAAQGAKCGYTGDRWSPFTQVQYAWCMQQKTQQQVWSEHNARLAQLADCAKKEAASAPPKMNTSVGAPVVKVLQDVDIYKLPGGEGKPFGSVKGGTSVQVYERHPDQWCYIAGHDVPDPGNGWVWCGKGFELN